MTPKTSSSGAVSGGTRSIDTPNPYPAHGRSARMSDGELVTGVAIGIAGTYNQLALCTAWISLSMLVNAYRHDTLPTIASL